MLDARGLYIIFAGSTATAAQCWEDGVVPAALKHRWEAVSIAVAREREDAIAEVIARREGTSPSSSRHPARFLCS